MKQTFFILGTTLIMGMVAGAYIYYASRPTEPLFDSRPDEVEISLQVTADSYGGCMRGGSCGSYRINEDGTYTFIIPTRDGEDIRTEGTLGRTELRALKDLINDTNLGGVQNSTFTGTCPITFDGLGYTYRVTVDGEEYIFDTCEHDTEGVPLFETLEIYFSELASE